jgi:membrane protease YdiL (CAAX protease family)/DNA-binding beta-propeller fold protein YncE
MQFYPYPIENKLLYYAAYVLNRELRIWWCPIALMHMEIIIIIVCIIMIIRKSRIFSILLFILFCLDRSFFLFMWSMSGGLSFSIYWIITFTISAIFAFFFFQGIRGTLAYHRLKGPLPSSILKSPSLIMKEMAYQSPQEIPGEPSRREQIFEVSIFLLFLIIPMAFGALFFLHKPEKQAELDFFWMAISSMFELLVLVALIVFFAWRNKEPMGRFGWNFKNGWRDIGLGIVLYFPLILGIGLLGLVIAYLWQLVFPVPLKGAPQIPAFLIPQKGETWLAFIFICVVATCEEFIFRGYLLRRFQAIFGTTMAAILLSSAIFAVGHFYQGFQRIVLFFFVGIFYAVLTLRRQSLVSPIVLHFLQNIMIVLIPLFGIDIGALQPNHNIIGHLHGHKAGVNSIAFSPDGKLLASGSNDKTIVLWDVATHQPHGKPLKHGHRIASVAFSPDGKLLASASQDDSKIILWNVATYQRQGTPLIGHKKPVYGVAFSPDGKLLASVGDDGVMLWNLETPQHREPPLMVHKGGGMRLAFSPDGKYLASANSDEVTMLWTLEPHKPRGTPLTGHKGWVMSVAFSPNGKLLASGSTDKTIILWDVETHKPLGPPLKGHQDSVKSVVFSPEGKLLASGSTDRTIMLWDVATRQPRGEPLTGHKGWVNSVAFTPEGKLLASAGFWDETILLWDVGKLQTLKSSP